MSRTLTLALAQFRPRKGDYAANLARIGEILAQVDALDPRPSVLQLPEAALTGYFVEGGVRDLAVTAGALARDLDATYRRVCPAAHPLEVVVGFYERWENALYNSALAVTVGDGGPVIHHVHRKVFLPTYGLFDEERFVERGSEVRAYTRPWGRAAILVCEDAWHSLTGTIAALDGAEVVFVCSAAPARGVWPRADAVPGPASVARWDRLMRDIAEEHGVYACLANLVGSEGGKTFGGTSTVIGPKGDVRARASMHDEAIVTATVDLGDLTRARADVPLLTDLRTMLPHLTRNVERVEGNVPVVLRYDAAPSDPTDAVLETDAAPDSEAGGTERAGPAESGGESAEEVGAGIGTRAGAAPEPNGAGAPPEEQGRAARAGDQHRSLAVVRAELRDCGGPPPLEIDGPLVERWLVTFIRDELARRGFSRAVLGLSGGVDSAVTAFLAARALGPENVVGIRLPYRTSSGESLAHARLVSEALGIEERTLDISPAVDGYLASEPDADAARRGNVMARMRMIAIFDLSAKHRALPLGTGNKTERLFGYFTWHADDSPPVNPLGDLFKSQVWALARQLGVPEVVVGKPASADLIQGQTDEGDFGISYARADVILNWLLHGHSAADLAVRGYTADEVALVRRRLEGTHWKRRMPSVAMLSPTAIGESYLRPVDY